MNFFADCNEWKWHFKNGIDWDTIIPLYYPKFPTEDGLNSKEEVIEFLYELLSTTGDWAGGAIAERARRLDEVGAGTIENGRQVLSEPLQELYNEARELQYFGLAADPKYGGLGLPNVANLIVFANISRACTSSATQLGFFTSIIDMVERFCDEEDKKRLLPKLINGEISGSMCLTEAGAGSDVASIKTTATKQEDGTYKINGAKIFITNGGGGLDFVLAKVKNAPKGLEGISMFIVEEMIGDKQNYYISKSEHKMGLHGSFTCEVVYEDSVGKLIGEENQGFQYMLHLMNEARNAVGLQALGGLEACIGYAKEYADTRKQFGSAISELPLLKRNFEDWETERDAFRALMVDTISHFDIYAKLDMMQREGHELTKEQKESFKQAKKWVRRRTPLVKYYGAEMFTLLSQRSIQALGGYGYMKEYDAERYHRDSFAPLLYEGTSQIQSLMAMKDVMKFIMKKPGRYFQTMMAAHPAGSIFDNTNKYIRDFTKMQYVFKRNLSSLLVKTLRPDMKDIFNTKNWLSEDKFNVMMTHAETLCQAMAYLETLRVLALHAAKDKARAPLFRRYQKLSRPRLASIYTDWKNS
jgi:alkylation response protein AidB-like acyl-CoA dehydrogenase